MTVQLYCVLFVLKVKVALVGGVALEQDIVIGHLPLDDATPPYSFAV